jgi:hypothetical protein
MRDTRMVERKKTGRAKARKGVSSFWSHNTVQANVPVHLGQALIDLNPMHHLFQHVYTSTYKLYPHPRMVLLIVQLLNELFL